MTSDNSKSQIDFSDLKIMKIKIQALLLLRFNKIRDLRLYYSTAQLLTYYLVANKFPNNFNHIIICRFLKKNITKKCLQCKDKLVSDLPIILNFGSKNPKL